ncbi:MAG: hypothetical protein U0556_11905 [Dehalococcoidia bacterium]
MTTSEDTVHPTSGGSPLVAGLIGIAVCVVCLLPPIIHFITGPLGPFIGGAVGGGKITAGPRAAIGVGLTMGIGLAIVALVFGGLTIGILASLPAGSGPEFGLPQLGILALIALVYGGLLGTGGAWFGGWMKRRG